MVYVSTAGHLPCKHVIHAVIPDRAHSPELGLEDAFLRIAVFGSLSTASQRGFSSIAFPAPGCDTFGYNILPVDRSTKIIIVAVQGFLATDKSSLRTVSLVDPANNVLDAFRNSLVVEFGSQMVTSRFGRYNTSQGAG